MSGLELVTATSRGTAAWGDFRGSQAWNADKQFAGSIQMPDKTLSWLASTESYTVSFWAVSQQVKMWAVVHIFWLHSVQADDTLNCHVCSFIGMGRESEVTFSRNGISPFVDLDHP